MPPLYTDTRGCEDDPALAMRVNGDGTRNVTLACRRAGAALLYVSTNEVFDGAKGEPYLETDEPRAINAYGSSKLLGEQHARSLLRRAYIVRTSWLYGGGNDFPAKVLQAAVRRAAHGDGRGVLAHLGPRPGPGHRPPRRAGRACRHLSSHQRAAAARVSSGRSGCWPWPAAKTSCWCRSSRPSSTRPIASRPSRRWRTRPPPPWASSCGRGRRRWATTSRPRRRAELPGHRTRGRREL